jgi:L-lactate dehydrogenase complex protein LldG
MSSPRRTILDRVAAATVAATSEPVPRRYRHTGALSDENRIELFCSRVGEYRAAVEHADSAEVAATIAVVCSAQNAKSLVAPAGLPPHWHPGNVNLVEDRPLSARELDAVDGALTGCTVAVAGTGTIILTAQAHEGRRVLTLVPDLHICVVRESQIVELLPESFGLLRAEQLESRPITLISGPSATSDIELARVEGVHGPRRLVVVVVRD